METVIDERDSRVTAFSLRFVSAAATRTMSLLSVLPAWIGNAFEITGRFMVNGKSSLSGLSGALPLEFKIAPEVLRISCTRERPG